jgi:GYF domain 2
MRWYVARDGNSEGPFDDDEFASFIQSGAVARGSLIREESEKKWTAVEKHKQMAAHLPRMPAGSGGRGLPWAPIATVAGVLTLGAVGALIYLQVRTHDALLARIDNATKHVDAVLLEIRDANAPPKWVPQNEVHNDCYTDRTNVSCTFTNLGETPVTTCTRGKLSQKAAPGIKLETVIMCTGKLYPAETRVVVGPWVGGFADDVCYKQNDFGKSLDFSKCIFDNETIDLPTLRKMDAVAAAK